MPNLICMLAKWARKGVPAGARGHANSRASARTLSSLGFTIADQRQSRADKRDHHAKSERDFGGIGDQIDLKDKVIKDTE